MDGFMPRDRRGAATSDSPAFQRRVDDKKNRASRRDGSRISPGARITEPLLPNAVLPLRPMRLRLLASSFASCGVSFVAAQPSNPAAKADERAESLPAVFAPRPVSPAA